MATTAAENIRREALNSVFSWFHDKAFTSIGPSRPAAGSRLLIAGGAFYQNLLLQLPYLACYYTGIILDCCKYTPLAFNRSGLPPIQATAGVSVR